MMADEREHIPQESDASTVEQEVTGGFFPSIVDIFIDPMKVFHRIAAGMNWWQPFIAVSIIGIILAVVNTPLQEQLIEMQYSNGDAEQYEQMKAVMEKWKYIGYIAIPIVVLISNVIVAGVAHLINSVVSMRASFKKTLSLVMYCSIIGVLSQVIGTLVVWARGIDTIESVEDLRVSFGLGALVPDLKGFWYVLSESLSLFQIWYYILFVFGVAAIFSIERKKALVAGVAVWLISFLLLYIQNLGGRMMG